MNIERTFSAAHAEPYDGEEFSFGDFSGRAERRVAPEPERFPAIVIGGGQAGLAAGYQLKLRGIPFVILDASDAVGDSWRNRWDSLKLFTPAAFDGLDGMRFPAPAKSFPTKDAMADYLAAYAKRFRLPVRNGVKIERLWREGGRYVLTDGKRRYEADQVIVAMSGYQVPKIPDCAGEIDRGTVQLHSADYRHPKQLRWGPTLLVGAGNSAAEIALEVAKTGRPVYMAGRDVGAVPFRMEKPLGASLLGPLLLRLIFRKMLTTENWLGRLVRPAFTGRGGPLIRVKPGDLRRAGVNRLPRLTGVVSGQPKFAGEEVLPVDNIIWCTGFTSGLSRWIDLPVFAATDEPKHERGVVLGEPGLYFVGLPFLHSAASSMVQGVSRDAAYVAEAVTARITAGSWVAGAIAE